MAVLILYWKRYLAIGTNLIRMDFSVVEIKCYTYDFGYVTGINCISSAQGHNKKPIIRPNSSLDRAGGRWRVNDHCSTE